MIFIQDFGLINHSGRHLTYFNAFTHSYLYAIANLLPKLFFQLLTNDTAYTAMPTLNWPMTPCDTMLLEPVDFDRGYSGLKKLGWPVLRCLVPSVLVSCASIVPIAFLVSIS